MYKDDKKYHMDLKENARGRFLKVSETFTRGYSRFQVILRFLKFTLKTSWGSDVRSMVMANV